MSKNTAGVIPATDVPLICNGPCGVIVPIPTLPNILPLPTICKVEPEILLEAEMLEAVNAPVKVVAPVTLKVPPTAVLPVVRRVEDEILLEAEMLEAVNAPLIIVFPFTSSKAAGDVVPIPTLLLPLTKTIMVFQLLKEVPAVPAATYSKLILLPPPIFMAHAVSLAA